jgi:hypothetical protein
MQLDGALEFAREDFDHCLTQILAKWSNSNTRKDDGFERRRDILQRRLGIGGTGDSWTLAALGTDNGISAERIRQIQKQALTRLLPWNRRASLPEWTTICGYFPLDADDEHLADTALQLLGDQPKAIVPLWLNIAGHTKPRRTTVLSLLRDALAERDRQEISQRRAYTARERAAARQRRRLPKPRPARHDAAPSRARRIHHLHQSPGSTNDGGISLGQAVIAAARTR